MYIAYFLQITPKASSAVKYNTIRIGKLISSSIYMFVYIYMYVYTTRLVHK